MSSGKEDGQATVPQEKVIQKPHRERGSSFSKSMRDTKVATPSERNKTAK